MASERVYRLLRLITLLQSRTPWSASDLAREMGVSRRTIFRDLNALEEAGMPCHHVEGQGYRLGRSTQLPPMSLNAAEVLGLMQLIKQAGAQRSRPMHAAALSAMYKLISTAPESLRSTCAEMIANVSIRPDAEIAGEAESAYYQTLHRAIAEQRVCQLRYTSPVEGDAMELTFHPYALHHANRAWYLLGHSPMHDEVRVLKLVRIDKLDLLKKTFTRPRGFSVAQKLGHAWRLIPEGKVHKIELRFTPRVATNVAEVRWHHSQSHEIVNDGSCVMRFEVDGLREIAWWVCGYADQVKVVKPKQLAQLVAEMHQRAAQQYE
ncbi:MAG: helix-turn-helix transcriptional regulator [Phycisphaerales bacterium JB063]